MYFWYKLLTYLFYPFAPIYLQLRKLKNKEIQKYNSATEKKIGFRGAKKKYKGNIITQWEKDNTLDC